jgi:NNP family nitrate/nitrite transporter-like MFS transporter
MVWSMVVAKLPAIGFAFSPEQFSGSRHCPLSQARPAHLLRLHGANLRRQAVDDGFNRSLLLPAIGIGYAVQNPNTPYLIFVVLALLCGLGGGNFASSMANISFFFPKSEKGNALALNAGLGNLGVSVMQFLVPLVITAGVFGSAGRRAADDHGPAGRSGCRMPASSGCPSSAPRPCFAWLGMNDLADAKASFRSRRSSSPAPQLGDVPALCRHLRQLHRLFRRLPAAVASSPSRRNALQYVFLGPLVGALSRAGTGWLADRFGGGRVTFWVFVGMIVAVLGVIWSLDGQAFTGFFACFMALFFFTGVGNASTFQMIPVIMRKEVPRLMPDLKGAGTSPARRRGIGIVAFTSAIGAYGGFFIPKAYGTSIGLTGSPLAHSGPSSPSTCCASVLTWAVYTRKGGLLH